MPFRDVSCFICFVSCPSWPLPFLSFPLPCLAPLPLCMFCGADAHNVYNGHSIQWYAPRSPLYFPHLCMSSVTWNRSGSRCPCLDTVMWCWSTFNAHDWAEQLSVCLTQNGESVFIVSSLGWWTGCHLLSMVCYSTKVKLIRLLPWLSKLIRDVLSS